MIYQAVGLVFIYGRWTIVLGHSVNEKNLRKHTESVQECHGLPYQFQHFLLIFRESECMHKMFDFGA